MKSKQIIEMSPQFILSNEVCIICKNKYKNKKGKYIKKKGDIWLSDPDICYDCWKEGHYG